MIINVIRSIFDMIIHSSIEDWVEPFKFLGAAVVYFLIFGI